MGLSPDALRRWSPNTPDCATGRPGGAAPGAASPHACPCTPSASRCASPRSWRSGTRTALAWSRTRLNPGQQGRRPPRRHLATLSSIGNKVITTGSGMIITDDEELTRRAKHLTTTAKVPHPYEFVHDEIGYNYRVPSLNAALGCAHMVKTEVAACYREFFASTGVRFVEPLPGTTASYWLNAIVPARAGGRGSDAVIQAGEELLLRALA